MRHTSGEIVVVSLIGTIDPILWIVIEEIIEGVEELGQEFIGAG